jgi:Flp pilus assembly protein TadD
MPPEVPSQTTPPPRENHRFSWAGIAAAIGVAGLFIAATIQKIWGVDIWWQMAAGRWILANGRFPVTDVLSYSAPSHAWIEVRWVFCVLAHLGWNLGGPNLLILAQAAILGGVWALAWLPSRRIAPGSPWVWGILALGIASGLSRWVVRPELFSYLFIAAYVSILEAAAPITPATTTTSPLRRRLLWLLPLCQVVWTNSHTLFAIGPIFVVIWACARSAQALIFKPRGQVFDLPLIGAALLTLGACWLNPYGHAGAMFPVLLFTQIQSGHVVSRTIGEMTPLMEMPWARWTLDLRLCIVLLIATLASFAFNRKRLNLPRLALVIATAYLATRAQRNAALLAVVGTMAAVRNVVEALEAKRSDETRFAAAGRIAVALASTALAWFVASDRYPVSIDAPREFGLGVVWWNTARDATKFAVEHKLPGPVFNHIRDGGYLAWAAQNERAEGIKVFSDGRLEVYGPEFLEALTQLSPTTWPAMEKAWKFNTLIIPVQGNEDFVRSLASLKRWELVYLDHRDVIFVRLGEDGALPAGVTKLDAKAAFDVPSDDRPTGFKALIGGVARAWRSEGYAMTYLALESWDNARKALEQGLAFAPDNLRLAGSLAPLAWRAGDENRAKALISSLPPDRRSLALQESARLLMLDGKGSMAVTALRQAADEDQTNRTLAISLADTLYLGKDFAGSRKYYERAFELGAASANELNKFGSACEQTDDLASAARAFQASLKLDGAQPVIWNMLGGIAANMGDLPNAQKCFAKALELKPDFAAAKNNLERARQMSK